MAVVNVSIENSNMDAIKNATTEAISAALEAIGMQAESYAKLACPVDTGNLRNSITHQQADEMTEAIGTNVEYAAYVEMGTSRMEARPYLGPALTEHVDEYKRMVEQFLRNA